MELYNRFPPITARELWGDRARHSDGQLVTSVRSQARRGWGMLCQHMTEMFGVHSPQFVPFPGEKEKKL